MTWDDEDDLSRLELDLRGRLADAGVAVAAASEVAHRDADVRFSHPAMTPTELAGLLRQMSPTIAFVTTSRFDPASIDSADGLVRAAAAQLAGRDYRLSVVWASGGILFEWAAVADWHEMLRAEDAMTEEPVPAPADLPDERTSAATQLMDIVMRSPAFRGATMTGRTAQVKIIMDAHPDLVAELSFPNDFPRRARVDADVQVTDQESQLESDAAVLDQLAAELAGGRPVNQQRMRVAELLRAAADGWALSEGFVEKMRLCALDRAPR